MSRAAAAARVLDRAPGVRAMTAVIAIMLFFTLLAAAGGLATGRAAGALDRRLGGRLTEQLPPGAGDADALASSLAALPEVRAARRVPPQEMARLLAPWLGDDAGDADLPLPALIDVHLKDGGGAGRVAAAAARLAPEARVERHAGTMALVGGLLRALATLAWGLVALMLGATASVAVLAARAGLDAHRATIEVLHMLAATDVQVARLFARRIARDAALGDAVGAAAAAAVMLFLAARVALLGSELLGGATLGPGGWAALAAVPIAFALLAAVAARWTVVRTLRRTL